jgi:uncharacterized protein (TIGR03000 family)
MCCILVLLEPGVMGRLLSCCWLPVGGKGGGGGGGGKGGGAYRGGGGGYYRGGGGYYRGGYGYGGYGVGIGLGLGYPNYGAYGPGYGDNYYSDPGYNYPPPVAVVAGAPPVGQQSYYAGPPPAPTNGAASLNVILPAGGSISFGSFQAQQAAGAHQYETPALDAGNTYSYTVQAQWTENGQPVTRTKVVKFQAGQRVLVDFANPSNG